MGVMTLTEFLLARIAEDEAAARTASPGPWSLTEEWASVSSGSDSVVHGFYEGACPSCGDRVEDDASVVLSAEDAVHIARHDPARVLAECEAKRRIVATCAQYEYEVTNAYGYDDVLKALALPYADHPDYRQEWKP